MGMYTQIRGWLNVDSIGSIENKYKLEELLNKAKEEYNAKENLDRKWVCEDTILHLGGNNSAYLFIGTELKNYDKSVDEWIKTLIKTFTNAEGRIDFQYEEDNEDTGSRFILIKNGEIIKDTIGETWCRGYGNMFSKL